MRIRILDPQILHTNPDTRTTIPISIFLLFLLRRSRPRPRRPPRPPPRAPDQC